MFGRELELLANNVASVCMGLKGKSKSNLLIAKGQSQVYALQRCPYYRGKEYQDEVRNLEERELTVIGSCLNYRRVCSDVGIIELYEGKNLHGHVDSPQEKAKARNKFLVIIIIIIIIIIINREVSVFCPLRSP